MNPDPTTVIKKTELLGERGYADQENLDHQKAAEQKTGRTSRTVDDDDCLCH